MKSWNPFRWLVRRPAPTAPVPPVHVFVSVDGQGLVRIGTFETRLLADEASQQWAARHVFKTGKAASFHFSFQDVR